MNEFDIEYAKHCYNIITHGSNRGDRTGNGTTSLFGVMNTFDVSKAFPLLTLKTVDLSKVLVELLWFIRGDTNIKYLLANSCGIWNKDAYRYFTNYIIPNAIGMPEHLQYLTRAEFVKTVRSTGETPITVLYLDSHKVAHQYALGDLGPVYGRQWNTPVNGEGQLDRVVRELIENPESRRLLVSAWDPEDMWGEEVALPCCHYSFQFYVDGDTISLMYNMRSNDVFLGQPFNIPSYAALLYAVCHLAGKKPGVLKQSTGDAHIYNGHRDAVKELLDRSLEVPAPTMRIVDREQKRLSDFVLSDFILEGYTPQGPIQAEMYT